MQFFKATKINFIGKRTLLFIISGGFVIIGIIANLIFPPAMGIDFTGGTEIAVDFHQPIHTDQIRSVMESSGLIGAEIKSYGKDNQFLLRLKSMTQAKKVVGDILKEKFPTYNAEIIKVDQIGPKIGKELGVQALLAVLLSLIVMLIYVAFRFEFVFGFGAIIALIHDVLFTFSFVTLFNHLGLIDLEINQSFVAAMLTVVGFSMNDTVIVFDRIRENKERFKGFDFIKMVNLSINETLSRTINTVLTVVLVLATLLAFGGPVLEGFAFTMLIGIIIGTYSSIYIASSYVIWYMEHIQKIKFKEFKGTAEDFNESPAKA